MCGSCCDPMEVDCAIGGAVMDKELASLNRTRSRPPTPNPPARSPISYTSGGDVSGVREARKRSRFVDIAGSDPKLLYGSTSFKGVDDSDGYLVRLVRRYQSKNMTAKMTSAVAPIVDPATTPTLILFNEFWGFCSS